MTVKIVTDSGSDIPLELAKKLGITIVPVYIYFGDKAYKDGVDIGPDELYKRLVEGPVYPTTTQPMPADFAETYTALAKDADAIVSIHLPTKVSGTYNAALQGLETAKPKCEVHVFDSLSVSIGLGLIVIAAARVANSGSKLTEVLEETRKAISKNQMRGLLDTLQYLLKGGRITKTRALVGALLNVKPILTMRQGELVQAGMARSYAKGVERVFEFVKNYPNLVEVGIAQSTVPEEAEKLKKMLGSVIDEKHILMSRIGAGLGVHGGPGTMVIAAMGG
ncbi:MAG: DegV family protein [Dehalococcoidia bacterium]